MQMEFVKHAVNSIVLHVHRQQQHAQSVQRNITMTMEFVNCVPMPCQPVKNVVQQRSVQNVNQLIIQMEENVRCVPIRIVIPIVMFQQVLVKDVQVDFI